MTTRCLLLLLSVVFFVGTAHAATPNGTVTSTAVITQHTLAVRGQHALPRQKTIYLMKVSLTSHEKQILQQPVQALRTDFTRTPSTSLPTQVNLGMNGTPVLDQGMHGTCATFANTAAINAVLGKGDYVSQLCHLELGAYLEKQGYFPSGWEGSFSGQMVLAQMLQFGIISKDNQHTHLCGGLKEYPTSTNDTGSAMSLEEFKSISDDISESAAWTSMLTAYQRFNMDPAYNYNGDKIITDVKTALASAQNKKQKVVVTFGALLPYTHCSSGACGKYHEDDDTWALTDAINYDFSFNYAGHEMIIIGYDDHAVAVDHDGFPHKGLFIIRNSWGDQVGDRGNYYMTYDFFKRFAIEVQEVMSLEE